METIQELRDFVGLPNSPYSKQKLLEVMNNFGLNNPAPLQVLCFKNGLDTSKPFASLLQIYNPDSKEPFYQEVNKLIVDESKAISLEPVVRAINNISIGYFKRIYFNSEKWPRAKKKLDKIYSYEEITSLNEEKEKALDFILNKVPKVLNCYSINNIIYILKESNFNYEQLIDQFQYLSTKVSTDKERQKKNENLIKAYEKFRVNVLKIGYENFLNKLIDLEEIAEEKDKKIVHLIILALNAEVCNIEAKKETEGKKKEEIYKRKHTFIHHMIEYVQNFSVNSPSVNYGYHLADTSITKVIYFDIEGIKQISWHCEADFKIPFYYGYWDNKSNSTLKKIIEASKKLFKKYKV